MKLKIASLFILFTLALSCKSSDPKDVENTDWLHTSENSLDWNGTYTGIFPCADCEGIKVKLTLNSDLTYSENYNYIGEQKHNHTSGFFRWNSDGSQITLVENGSKDGDVFIVGEDKLIRLDDDGHVIKKDSVNLYELKKS